MPDYDPAHTTRTGHILRAIELAVSIILAAVSAILFTIYLSMGHVPPYPGHVILTLGAVAAIISVLVAMHRNRKRDFETVLSEIHRLRLATMTANANEIENNR